MTVNVKTEEDHAVVVEDEVAVVVVVVDITKNGANTLIAAAVLGIEVVVVAVPAVDRLNIVVVVGDMEIVEAGVVALAAEAKEEAVADHLNIMAVGDMEIAGAEVVDLAKDEGREGGEGVVGEEDSEEEVEAPIEPTLTSPLPSTDYSAVKSPKAQNNQCGGTSTHKATCKDPSLPVTWNLGSRKGIWRTQRCVCAAPSARWRLPTCRPPTFSFPWGR